MWVATTVAHETVGTHTWNKKITIS